MRVLDTMVDAPETIHAALTARDTARLADIEATARAIVDDVRARGDAALLDYTRKFDWPGATQEELQLSQDTLDKAWHLLPAGFNEIIGHAERNIEGFHESELGHLQSWMKFSEEEWLWQKHGSKALGQILQPVQRVGVYVPGGKAAYPSTVLMAAIPAIVAGVEDIVFCTPCNSAGQLLPLVTATLGYLCREAIGRSRWVFCIGGAQAIAAMAYGTETIPKCDVIVGPGNAYVNAAKRLVYGDVGIDMLAGPSEVAVIADAGANPAFAAADLLAQTEHGPDNRGVLLCSSTEVLEHCKSELAQQRTSLKRQDVLTQSANNLLLVKTRSVEESVALSNVLAPEHLELMVREPLAVLPLVKSAGAVLLGDYTSAPIGDYWAGPSHTLPTAGTARFSSPLSVATFLKRTSVLYYSQEAAQAAAEDVARFAVAEGFDGHARAARLRGKGSA